MNTHLRVRNARTRGDFELVGSLIYDRYLEERLIDPNSRGIKIFPHQLMHNSIVLMAYVGEEMICTATLTISHDVGKDLPSYRDFEDEISRLYQKSEEYLVTNGELLELAEISALAGSTTSLRVITDFFGLIYLIGIAWDLHGFIFCCHPRHTSYYAHQWSAVQIGSRDKIERVNHHPGRLLVIPLTYDTVRRHKRIFNRILQNDALPVDLEPVTLSDMDRMLLSAA